MNKTQLLFFTILVEGYVVLTCELLAIRQVMPFVGSGIETTAIIISGVLLPLAVGYHFGGQAYQRAYARARTRGHRSLSIRKILLRNIFISLLFLCFGLSTLFLEFFFGYLRSMGVYHRLAQTAIYSAMFLVVPTFLLGQTVPLVSNYFSRRKLSEITGKMLFFSTTGSFLGSLFSTIVLMSVIGTHHTVIVTLGLLTLLGILLSGRQVRRGAALCVAALMLCWMMNSNFVLRSAHVVSDNAYNTVRVLRVPHEDSLMLEINRSISSKWSSNPEHKFEYIKFIEENFIAPLALTQHPPREILVVGAGGFTLGYYDHVNNYTFVDIDAKLKDVAEGYFLPDKLGHNKQFVASSARAFVHNTDKKYDLIILDVYTMVMSIPMECTTKEFLEDVKRLLAVDGIVVANIISDPAFKDKFSKRYDATFSSVFPTHSRQVIDAFNPWFTPDGHQPEINYRNIMYSYYNNALANDAAIYTDEQNTYSIDRP